MELLKWLTISDRYCRMYMDKELSKLGLNSGQHFYIIRICEAPGITQDQLLSLVHVNPSNVTRAIAYLEKAEFLIRQQNEKDRRTFYLYPTSKSLAVYPKILAIQETCEHKFLNEFSDEEKEVLECLLKKLGTHAVTFMKMEKEEHHER